MQYDTMYIDTIIGVLEIRSAENSVISIQRVINRGTDSISSPLISSCAFELEEYFSGKRTVFSFPLNLIGTAFQKKVWDELLKIPYGESISYKQLAARVGSENASRAVGNAVGKNPVLIVVPCHRIIASSGKLGGFSAGIDAKETLLKLENITYS